MKKHKEIDNPFALANYMKKKGAKPHYPNVGEDAYSEEFDVALERVLQPNDPLEKWKAVFQAADFNKPGNFQFGKYNPQNRTPEKRERMAKAASYAAKNPSNKK